MRIILVTRDLAIVSQVDGAAARRGGEVRAVADPADVPALCVAGAPDALVIDLGTPSLDVASLVDQVKSAAEVSPRFIAFGPHVHVDKLAAARGAGCDEVLSRGQFLGQLDSILQLD